MPPGGARSSCNLYWKLGTAEVLDPHGGTEIVQMSPAYLEIAAGADELRALRL